MALLRYLRKHPISSLFRLLFGLLLLCMLPLVWFGVLQWWGHLFPALATLFARAPLAEQAHASLVVLASMSMGFVAVAVAAVLLAILWLFTEPWFWEPRASYPLPMTLPPPPPKPASYYPASYREVLRNLPNA